MSTILKAFTPDFESANRDLDELTSLSRLCNFDLFEFMRLLSEAAAPVMTCEVDDAPAIATGSSVARYKLSEALLVILSALRARNLDGDKIEGVSAHTHVLQ